MNSDLALFVAHCQGHAHFPQFVEEAKKLRPIIPPYNGKNTEEWKTQSGRQQGYDAAMQLLKIYFNGD